jgi:hypothetical protein
MRTIPNSYRKYELADGSIGPRSPESSTRTQSCQGNRPVDRIFNSYGLRSPRATEETLSRQVVLTRSSGRTCSRVIWLSFTTAAATGSSSRDGTELAAPSG